MASYLTRDGDRLDQICSQYYGQAAGAVEAVLEANPGLALSDPVLPAGIKLELPMLSLPRTTEKVRLWD